MDSSAPSFSLGTPPLLAASPFVALAWHGNRPQSVQVVVLLHVSSHQVVRFVVVLGEAIGGIWGYLALTLEGKRRGNICSASWHILSSLLRILTSLAFGFVCVWWTCSRIVNVRALDLDPQLHHTRDDRLQCLRPTTVQKGGSTETKAMLTGMIQINSI